MNISEIASRIIDLYQGKKVEGIVAAVLPQERPTFQRYVVKTQEILLDVQVGEIENHDPIVINNNYTHHPPLNEETKLKDGLFILDLGPMDRQFT